MDRHETHREHIENRLEELEDIHKRVLEIEKEMQVLTLIKRGVFGGVGLVLMAVFGMIWSFVTGSPLQ